MRHQRLWLAIGALCAVAAVVGAEERSVPDLPRALSTCYLHEPFAGAHTIRIVLDDRGGGVVEFDANTVRFGPLGEEVARTQMEPARVPVQLKPIGRIPGGMRVYELQGGEALSRTLAGLGLPGHGLRLLAGEGECGPYRLHDVDEAAQLVRVVSLER